MSKCEHGLTSKECYVCASPKVGKHSAPADDEAVRLLKAARKIGHMTPNLLIAINAYLARAGK